MLLLTQAIYSSDHSGHDHSSLAGSGDHHEGSGTPDIVGSFCSFDDTYSTTRLECSPDGIKLSIRSCAFQDNGFDVDGVFMGGIKSHECLA